MIAAGAVFSVLLVGGLVVVLAGGDDGAPAPAEQANRVAPAPAEEESAQREQDANALTAADKRDTSVAVLNGTTVTGLARQVADRVGQDGFTIGTVTDAANQAQTESHVDYTAGFQRHARAVAAEIGLPSSRVRSINAVDATTAGSSSEVVVVVGQDLAQG
jgi:hypothetical protein